MAAPLKQEKETQGTTGRRSTRLFISIPITLSGQDSAGHTFKENTKTLIINKHGAKVSSVHQLNLGAEVSIENRALGRTAKASVVWVGDRTSPKDSVEMGLQLTEAQNIWGIEFPPDDWQEGAPIGVGGKRLEKPIATAPAKPPEAPPSPRSPVKAAEAPPPPPPASTIPPTPEPVATPSSSTAATLPLDVRKIAGEAGMVQLRQMTREAPQADLKPFEEQLAKLANEFSFRTQASLQEAASRLEEKTVRSLEQQLVVLEGRLQASRDEVETLVTRFQELQNGNQGIVETTERSIREASGRALQAAIKELEGKVRKDLDAASSSFIQETRQRVQDEASAAMEALSQKASKHLASLREDFLSRATPELQARQKQITDEARAQIAQALEATSDQVREKIYQIANEVAPSLRSEMEASLVEYAGELINRLTQSFEEQTQASNQAAEESLQQSLEKVQQAIQQEILSAASKVRQSYEAEAEKANRAVSEQVARSIEQTFKLEADAYRKRLFELSASSLEGFQSKADALQEGFDGRLQRALQKSEDKVTQGVVDKLQKIADDLLDSLARQLGKQGEETLQMLSGELRSEGRDAISDTEKQMRAAIQASLDSLTFEAQTTSEEYRSHLRKTLQEFQDRNVQDLQTQLQQASDRHRQAILEMVERGIDDLINKALVQTKNKVDETVIQATDIVHKNVGASAVALKDWEEQAKVRLERFAHKVDADVKASAEALQRQREDLYDAVLDKVRKDADALLEDLSDRLQQAARVFQDKGVETIQSRLHAVTDELVEATAGRLRKQTEQNLDHATDQLRERQQEAVNQAETLFRNSLADMLRAVIQLGPKKTRDLEPSETEITKKRL